MRQRHRGRRSTQRRATQFVRCVATVCVGVPLHGHTPPVMPLEAEERNEIQRLLDVQGDGRKFRDPDFLTEEMNLETESRQYAKAWRRPRKLVEKPVLVEDEISSMDVQQGALGDCWFLAAAAAVAQYPDLIRKVIPEDQSLYGKGYTGVLVFRFWRMGEWVSIYIDDRLPLDEDGDLLYSRCTSENEFWLPLLEKAFAKFHGNYQNLDGGFLAEGLLSLTGFIVSDVCLTDLSLGNAHQFISQELRNGSLFTCATNESKSKGLMPVHAYTITAANRLRLGDSLVRHVRVRNPHATGEWKGPWSDDDPNWDEVDLKIRESLGYENKDDGQFWMKMSHFVKHFPDVTLATYTPKLEDPSTRQLAVATHSWETGFNAGGSIDNREKFLENPQYTIIVQESGDPEEESDDEASDEWNIIIELIQEHDRSKYQDLHFIGFYVFKVDDPLQRTLTAEDLENVPYHTAEFINNSSVVKLLNVEPGIYILVPCTSEPDINRNFIVRVYSKLPITFLT